MRTSATLWDHLRAFPPWMVRLRAKASHNKALSEVDLAIASGIEINRLRAIIASDNYDGLTVREMRAFFAACGFDPTLAKDRQRAAAYDQICKKRNAIPYGYLRRSPKWESEILPIVKRLQAKMTEATRTSSAA